MDTNQVGLIIAGLSLLVALVTTLLPDVLRELKRPVRILCALGIAVGLVVVVAATWGGAGGGKGPGTATGSGTTVEGSTTSTPPASSSTDTTVDLSAVTVRWHKTIRVPQTSSVNFDDTFPRVGNPVSGADLHNSTAKSDTTANLYAYGSAGSAPGGAASFRGCADAAETAALATNFRLEPGKAVCVRTKPSGGDQPHLAHAKLLGVDRTGALS